MSVLRADAWSNERVSLKTDRMTAQQTAHLEGDDNMHARLLDCIDDRTATLQKSFCIRFMWTSTICCKLRHTG